VSAPLHGAAEQRGSTDFSSFWASQRRYHGECRLPHWRLAWWKKRPSSSSDYRRAGCPRHPQSGFTRTGGDTVDCSRTLIFDAW